VGYQWDAANPAGYANAMGRYKTAMELAFVRRHVAGHRRVLDVGGGSGRIARPLVDDGHDVTVCDVSADALALLAERHGDAVQRVHADVLTLPAEAGYDAVVAVESLQYLTTVSLAGALHALAGHLRPGGVLVLTALNAGSWRSLPRRWRERRGAPGYRAATAGGYRRAVAGAGLRVRAVEGFMWMPVPVTSDSALVPVWAGLERTLRLGRWTAQSPWLLLAADRPSSPAPSGAGA
jgi:SAM-dependent methyltransferase